MSEKTKSESADDGDEKLPKRLPEPSEPKKDKRHSYYYDDAHGYQIFQAEDDIAGDD